MSKVGELRAADTARKTAFMAAAALALALALPLLAGCGPREAATPGAAAAGSGVPDRALQGELEQQERVGQAHPREHLRELQAIEARAAAGSAERLEALSQRAALLAQLRDRSGHEAALEALKAWPEDSPVRAQVPLALMLAKAQWLKANGELGAGVRLLGGLQEIEAAKADRRLLWRATELLAYMQGDYGEVDAAVESGLKALEQARAMDSRWRAAITQATLAFNYFRSQQVDHAKRTAGEALQTAQQDPDPVLMYSIHTILGIVHTQDEDPRISQQAREQALQYAREAQAPSLQALALGNLADYELRSGNYARALELSTQSLALAHEVGEISTEILARHNMGIAKIGLRRLDEGKRDVLQAITMDAQREAGSYTADAWLELGGYLEKFDDLAGAVDAYHRSRKEFDEVLRDETRRTVLEAQARYEDQQRQREIRLLNQDNSLKSEQIRTRDLQLKLWAEVGGCVLLSGALLALAYRRIRRTNAALAQTNESLRVQSERDPLTGLANRRHFQQAIVELTRESGGLRGSLFLIDIDHFKRINDQWGHAAGDTVLVEVARRLRGVLREQDLVVRWGGEEFLILVKSESTEDARQLGQRLLDQMGAQPVDHGPLRIPISASIGFASFPMAPHDLTLEWERAIDLVDTVMYMAKAHGRNKAYGVAAMQARDRDQLLALAGRVESAWHQGQVQLVSLLGPVQEGRA
ncbi:diguanylate cyclase [Roseateles sp.]|uniref:diguanylate cyclase domain-containing protein n=1 Tax=Roseateles sp. TaxID=1971397 RepID=UPI0031D9DB43